MIWVFCILPVVNAVIDYLIIEGGARINHTIEVIIRFLLILLISPPEMVFLAGV